MLEDVYAYKNLSLLKRLHPEGMISEGVRYLMKSYAMQDLIERLAQRDLPYLKQYYLCDHYVICISVGLDKQTDEVFYQDSVLCPQALPPVSLVLQAKNGRSYLPCNESCLCLVKKIL